MLQCCFLKYFEKGHFTPRNGQTYDIHFLSLYIFSLHILECPTGWRFIEGKCHLYKTISVSDLFSDSKCEPYSQEACISATQEIGYKMGNLENSAFEFAGNYSVKGNLNHYFNQQVCLSICTCVCPSQKIFSPISQQL